MLNHCPVCHLRFHPLASEPVEKCSRCDADLQPLIRIHCQATRWLQCAVYHFLNGNSSAALRCIQQSQWLSRNHLTDYFYAFMAQSVKWPEPVS